MTATEFNAACKVGDKVQYTILDGREPVVRVVSKPAWSLGKHHLVRLAGERNAVSLTRIRLIED